MKDTKDSQNNKYELTFVGGMFSSYLALFVKNSLRVVFTKPHHT